MVHVKIAARPIGDDAQPEATETTSQELAEALSSLKPGSMGAASSPCRAGSPTDTSDSDGKSRSVNSDDELTASDSDSTKRANVIAAAATIGMTFNFGASNVEKVHIQVIEHVSYFTKGHARPPDQKIMPTPRADKVVVFEDVFSAGLVSKQL
jgi:hypothetical protein